MHQFCTLFDRNYLYKGLALHQSLIGHAEDFKLWILCMDDLTHLILSKLNLPNVRLVSLPEFEDEDLKRVKKQRSTAEYSWTCASNFCKFLLERHRLPEITYLDSDIYFFSSPEPVFSEIGASPIAIVEHHYSRSYQHLEKQSGRFNVEWVTFKNTEPGLSAIRWWSERVIEWCYARLEDGKFGDQMYLNDWPQRFVNVHIVKHKGAGLAPWNLGNYRINLKSDKVYVDEMPLVFYHFHTFSPISPRLFQKAVGYKFTQNEVKLVYNPYIKAIQDSIARVKQVDPTFHFGFRKFSFKKFLSERIKTLFAL